MSADIKEAAVVSADIKGAAMMLADIKKAAMVGVSWCGVEVSHQVRAGGEGLPVSDSL